MDKQITSAEDYVKLVSTKVDLPSGAVFHVRAPNPYELAELLKIMPEGGPPKDDTRTFLIEYLPTLWKPVVHPCILKPIVPVEMVPYEDAIVLLEAVIELCGVSEGGEDESFPDAEPSPDA